MAEVIQGAKSRKYIREDVPGVLNSGDTLEYNTVQEVSGGRGAIDSVIHGSVVVSTGHVIEAGSVKRLIKSTAHGAKSGWVMRPSSGNSQWEEIVIVKIVDADFFVISTEFDLAIADTFSLCRFVTPNYTADGDLNVVVSGSGPIEFLRDAVSTVVEEDTGTPADSRPLPVKILDANGLETDLATEPTLLDISNNVQLLFNITRKRISETLFFDYTGVSNAGYTQLIAALGDDVKSMTWFESSGQPMVVAIGAPGLEVDLFVVPPGGFNGEIPMDMETGDRVSIKQLNAEVLGSGIMIVANFFK